MSSISSDPDPIQEIMASETPEQTAATLVDRMFDLFIPAENRSIIFVAVCDTIATRKVKAMEQDPDCPWLLSPDDSGDNRLRKEAIRANEIDRQSFAQITDFAEVVQTAALLKGMEMDDKGTGWLDVNGQYHDLDVELERLMPGEEERRSSGRAKQLAAFIRKTKDILREHDIPDQQIASCLRTGKTSLLGHVSTAVNKVLTKSKAEEWDQDHVKEELEFVVEKAASCQYISNFGDWAAERYRDPHEPLPSPIWFSAKRYRERVLVAAEMDDGQYEHLFLARLGDVLRDAASDLFSAITPLEVTTAYETGDLSSLMRLAVLNDHAQAVCLGILEANQPNWVDMQFILSIPTVSLTEAQAEHALGELWRLGYAKRRKAADTVTWKLHPTSPKWKVS